MINNFIGLMHNSTIGSWVWEDILMAVQKDVTLYVYALETILYLLLFLSFVWWAVYRLIIVKRKSKLYGRVSPICPSDIYILVTLLFLTLGYASIIGLYARIIRPGVDILHTSEEYRIFLRSFIWDTRAIPRTIVTILILWRQARKVYREFFAKREHMRRRSDKDGEDI